VTFLADGCLVVVACDDRTFDVVLRGSLVRRNHHIVTGLLEIVAECADAINVSLGQLDELDDAGAAMLDEAARSASRAHVIWSVLDGDATLQMALDRRSPGDASATGQGPKSAAATRRRRRWPRMLPGT